MGKYVMQKSNTHPNGWVLTDTEEGIVVRFEDGKYNETQKVTIIDDKPNPSAAKLARVMREMGEWAVKYHSSKCFSQPYGYEYNEADEVLCLYRRNEPRWRLMIEGETDAEHLAASLRKAAEFVTKRK
ncbi:DNA breaking-rejoining protein [Hallella colorans]|uniref:DNA breaking-rejoining protein n=1 Tax=Hallella colorans TaxID=1703337 RepID=UPI0028897164|nr:DNA breaking-rejoining protein [Hallella colorans]